MTAEATQPDAAPPLTTPQQRYTAVAIALHWAIALLIVGLIAVGWIMDALPGGPGSPKTAIIQLHKSFGITVLLLSIARIIWRLMNPPPPAPAMPAWQKYLASTAHILLYVLIIAMPLTGWIMASAEINQHDTRFFWTFEMYVPGIPGLPAEMREPLAEGFEFVHHNLAWVIVGLLVLHVAGALKHQLVDKDGLLARMAPGLFGRTAGPPDNGHGAIWAFGASIVVFAAIASVSMLSGAPAAVAQDEEPQQAQALAASKAPAWVVDPAQSSIVFKAAYMGRPFEGRFPEWTATIQFDASAAPSQTTPVDGYVRVAIPTAKISTGEPYFDENVTQGDWFDVSKHPEAVFEVAVGGLYRLTDSQYEAAGVLKLKGVDYPVRLPFTLQITGAAAKMHGEVTLQRMAMDVGGDTRAAANPNNADEEWVRDDVGVVIDLVATRQ
jgi:cytochrome b561